MRQSLVLLCLCALLPACAHQGGGENAKSRDDNMAARERLEDRQHDGYCSDAEARRGNSPDCQRQGARKSEQREPALNPDELGRDLPLDRLGQDRGLPNPGGQGLLNR